MAVVESRTNDRAAEPIAHPSSAELEPLHAQLARVEANVTAAHARADEAVSKRELALLHAELQRSAAADRAAADERSARAASEIAGREAQRASDALGEVRAEVETLRKALEEEVRAQRSAEPRRGAGSRCVRAHASLPIAADATPAEHAAPRIWWTGMRRQRAMSTAAHCYWTAMALAAGQRSPRRCGAQCRRA